MKSLFIVSAATGYGGAERSVELLASKLQDAVRLTIFAEYPQHKEQLRAVLRPPAKLLTLRTGFRWRSIVLSAIKFSFFYFLYRPDAVLCNTHRSAATVAFAAKFFPSIARKSFLYIRDFMWTDLDLILKDQPWAQVLVPSNAVLDRKNYIGEYLVPKTSVGCSVIPDMVSVPEGSPESPLSGGAVLHLATINRWKGHSHLIAIAKLLRDSGRSVPFRSYGVVGDGDLQKNLIERIRGENLSDIFLLENCVSDPNPLLKSCLCVAVTSISEFGGPETFGRTIIEAWAHSKPVVAFAAGSTTSLIEHERDGLLIQEGDDAAFAEAIWRLQNDAGLCRQLGENGRKKVLRQFELETVAQQLLVTLERYIPN